MHYYRSPLRAMRILTVNIKECMQKNMQGRQGQGEQGPPGQGPPGSGEQGPPGPKVHRGLQARKVRKVRQENVNVNASLWVK